jgi:hypothetical protein
MPCSVAEWAGADLDQYPDGPNPYINIDGCDFMEEFNTNLFDFACIHMYPDSWLNNRNGLYVE